MRNSARLSTTRLHTARMPSLSGGTTGEASALHDKEHREALAWCCEYVNHRVPVVAGTGSNDTAYAIELTKFAAECGADAGLSVTPYYNKTTQRGLIAHYTAIADCSDLPIVLYNVPSRTGVSLHRRYPV